MDLIALEKNPRPGGMLGAYEVRMFHGVVLVDGSPVKLSRTRDAAINQSVSYIYNRASGARAVSPLGRVIIERSAAHEFCAARNCRLHPIALEKIVSEPPENYEYHKTMDYRSQNITPEQLLLRSNAVPNEEDMAFFDLLCPRVTFPIGAPSTKPVAAVELPGDPTLKPDFYVPVDPDLWNTTDLLYSGTRLLVNFSFWFRLECFFPDRYWIKRLVCIEQEVIERPRVQAEWVPLD